MVLKFKYKYSLFWKLVFILHLRQIDLKLQMDYDWKKNLVLSFLEITFDKE